jgi:hypothetical protein
LEIIVVLAVVIAVAVLPVKFAASLMGAGRTGFGWSVVVGSAIYAIILDTTFPKGFLIGVIAAVIAVLVVFVLGSLFAISVAAI